MKVLSSAVLAVFLCSAAQATENLLFYDGGVPFYPTHTMTDDADLAPEDNEVSFPDVFGGVYRALSGKAAIFFASSWPVVGFEDEPQDVQEIISEEKTRPQFVSDESIKPQAYEQRIEEGCKELEEIEELLVTESVYVESPRQPKEEELNFVRFDKSFEATLAKIRLTNWSGCLDVSGHDFKPRQIALIFKAIAEQKDLPRQFDLSPSRDYAHSHYLAALSILFLKALPKTQVVLEGLRLPENFHQLPGVKSVHFKNTTVYADGDKLQEMLNVIQEKRIEIND